MAIWKTMFTSILISLVILNLVESDAITMVTKSVVENPSPIGAPSPPKINCESACNERCRLASRQKMCKRACGTCCERCNCVPSGTSGHYEECPCYWNMKTHGGRRKCP